MRDNYYRDVDNVLRCGHWRKLHLVCEECEARDAEMLEGMNELRFFIKLLLWLVCIGAGIALGISFVEGP